MAKIITHRFASPKPDGSDPTQIQPSYWNDGHLLIGGAAGDVLTRDPTDATFGGKWVTPTPPAPVGVWVDIPYTAADFTGSGAMTWVVDAGDLTTFGYAIVGKTALVTLHLVATSVGGTLDSYLQVRLPAALTPQKSFEGWGFGQDTGSAAPIRARIFSGDRTIYLLKIAPGAWVATVNNTTITLQVAIPIA